ncbi:MAG: tetratricopeptide repeat protein [Chloroflexia bacterium]
MLDLVILEEEFQQKINYAKLLIRSAQADEGLQMLDDLESASAAYFDRLPTSIQYLLPYTRGRAYIQCNQTDLAKEHLEIALQYAEGDAEAMARTRNLLAVTYFQLRQPARALQNQLICVRAISDGTLKDLNLQMSIYQNLANTYLELNEIPQAISTYKKALTVLKNLDDPDRQAVMFWGIAASYQSLGNLRYARLYFVRAIQVYQSIGNRLAEAYMQLNMSEILIAESRITEARHSLKRVESLLDGVSSDGLRSFLYGYLGRLVLKEGDLSTALSYAEEGVRYAEMLHQTGYVGDPALWIDPVHAYVEALQSAALVHEALGNRTESDRLFKHGFELMEPTTLEEQRKSLHLCYAEILEARHDYQQAAYHYRRAAIASKFCT